MRLCACYGSDRIGGGKEEILGLFIRCKGLGLGSGSGLFAKYVAR